MMTMAVVVDKTYRLTVSDKGRDCKIERDPG